MQSNVKYIFLFVFLFFSIFLGAQNKDTPRDGEGIYAFLRRNNYSEKDYQTFIDLNKGKFGKNHSLILGMYYTLPSGNSIAEKETENTTVIKARTKRKEPLFGKKYEEYTIRSNPRLVGACFFLKSGHAGPDPGAIVHVEGHELHEDEYAYDVMLRLARNLLQEGATVHVIIQDEKDGIRDAKYLLNSKRETCMGKPIPLNQITRLKQRTDEINALSRKAKENYQRAIFIHLDSQNKDKQLDVYFYYQRNNEESRKMANTLRNTIESEYKRVQPNRGFSGTISPRDIYVLKNTRPVAVFAELANMRNPGKDRDRYLLENNRQALANWMLKGLIKDYEESKK